MIEKKSRHLPRILGGFVCGLAAGVLILAVLTTLGIKLDDTLSGGLLFVFGLHGAFIARFGWTAAINSLDDE